MGWRFAGALKAVVCVLLCVVAGSFPRRFFYNYWDDAIQTFRCQDPPSTFNRDEKVIMSTRQVTYDHIERADLRYTVVSSHFGA
jgi:hypothetical protein